MTKNELIQISKLIKILIEHEIANAQKPLLQEIKRLQNSVNSMNKLLTENKPISKQKSSDFSINDILEDIDVKPKQQKQNSLFKNSKSPIASIFEELTPFNESTSAEDVESVLDYVDDPKMAKSNDAVAKVLNTLQNTDFRKKLQIMENSANRHNMSEMNR